jgi:aerobic carbon-monoxide dehydrogenase small subunit
VEVRLTVNGRAVETTVPDGRRLCDWLRDERGLSGTKVGCGEGVCGSCTVLLDGDAVRSCLMLVAQADGHEVRTVEGLADGSLHPVQQAFVEHGALQCGFCTPGFVMSAVALLDADPAPTRARVVDGLAGNLCRCTGYATIVDAVLAAAEVSRDDGSGDASGLEPRPG